MTLDSIRPDGNLIAALRSRVPKLAHVAREGKAVVEARALSGPDHALSALDHVPVASWPSAGSRPEPVELPQEPQRVGFRLGP